MAGILLAGCAASPGATDPPAPVFAVAAEGEGNELGVSAEGETTVIDVRSPGGLGAATVELVSGTPPERVLLRLHLQGLEEFRLSFGETTIAASVSSGDSRSVFQRVVSPDGGEQSVAPGSPYWMDVAIVSDPATPRLPLEPGYFEIALPQGLLRDGPRAFSFRWIDFYR
jgi:hypothetical protein